MLCFQPGLSFRALCHALQFEKLTGCSGLLNELTAIRIRKWYCNAAALTAPPPPSTTDKRLEVRLTVLRKQQHGLYDELIPAATWRVLDKLHSKGYETYLVGGSVRDMLLNQVPKDFDILSTAEPQEVKKSFPGRCIIVGKRFPICHVFSYDNTLEVSSFSTNVKYRRKDGGIARKAPDSAVLDGTEGWDEKDFARWENSCKRDFTINALMYDPFKKVLYDYVRGLRDLKKLKVRTVISPEESLVEDPARILRAIRIAARLRFRFTKSTASAIKDQRFSLLKLNKGRLMLEANMLLAYGAAEPSVRLLWRYGVLELLFPLQAAYFVKEEFGRRDEGSNFLLDLLRNLDRVLAPDRPCHGSLWVALMAFHLAASDKQSSPLVTATAALCLYYNGRPEKAADRAKRLHLKREQERLVDTEYINSTIPSVDSLSSEATLLLEHSRSFLKRMVDSNENSILMHTLTGAEPEDAVAIGIAYSQGAQKLFSRAINGHPIEHELESNLPNDRKAAKENRADPAAVAKGDMLALGYIFSRIVLNTLFPRISVRIEEDPEQVSSSSNH